MRAAYCALLGLKPKENKNMLRLIKECWNGEHRLIDIVIGGLLFAFVFIQFIIIGSHLLAHPIDTAVFYIGLGFLILPYNIWWTVSVWRCAKNANRFWKYAARGFIVFCFAEYLYKLVA
jgi:hypothetical protein